MRGDSPGNGGVRFRPTSPQEASSQTQRESERESVDESPESQREIKNIYINEQREVR